MDRKGIWCFSMDRILPSDTICAYLSGMHMQVSEPTQYQCKVKVFNAVKRKKPITRQLHDFHGRFATIVQLTRHATEELKDALPKDCSVDREISLWVQPREEDDTDSDDPELDRRRKKTSRHRPSGRTRRKKSRRYTVTLKQSTAIATLFHN